MPIAWSALHKEVEEAESEAEEEEEGAQGETAAGKLDDGIEEAGRNDAEPRLASPFVEGSGGNVAREVAAEQREFVVHPEREFGTVTPKSERPENKDAITEKG